MRKKPQRVTAKQGTAKQTDEELKIAAKILEGVQERDGVPGPVIAECLGGAGLEVVFQVTECFV